MSTAPGGDGLGPQRAAVEAARQQLGTDLDRLISDTRAQMESTVEKIAWKLVVGAAGAGAGLLVTKALTIAWKTTRKTDPPTDPASRRTNLGEAIAWAAAVAAVAGVARVIATRGAAAGWQKATGQLPPGVEA